MSPSDRPSTVQRAEPTLREVLGGRRGAVDATAPVVAFVTGWLAAGWLGGSSQVVWGGAAAVLVALVVAVARLATGNRPRSVLVGLLGVVVAVLVALYTGRAVDFFLIQLLANAASALTWAVSIVVRWPLLGVVVGLVLGQRTRWRRDPDLMRGYQRASWFWVGQYLLRLAVFLPLYFADAVVALGVARLAFTWPLIIACIGVSWRVIRRTLPGDHPGLRHPRVPEPPRISR
ncbi:DUF3159 domain-containing protein [Pseudonocardia asaccharolytica]|uniref:DUF3159 domain-containing protein n=1 Tax=Pseudonocardia asaccharolytica DSM 44247 = NBRC 16224 TaxID=1123024 RepID=A0A511D7A5_9PSEU|nr:DUF3159 domain-containing protein [Pseudonocardia asaccharolytica]GEL20507.1 hypothetical protein PA7_43440 [Pseudonocardia asaccharolytica DSM 44247 = NBRC 16224]